MGTTYAPNATLSPVAQAAQKLEVTQEVGGARGRMAELNVTQKTRKDMFN